jgi:RHH-type transcriptional regulator, rel operon repressor / antitoxin RelB
MTRNVFTVRLPDDVKAELERLAEATNRSKSYLAAKAIEDYVRQNAWQVRELEQAVKEADAGDFVSEEAVYAWLDSWGTENELPAPVDDDFKKHS